MNYTETPRPIENPTLLDLTFIDMMERLGPENVEVQEMATQGEGKKIIAQIVSIVEGPEMQKRADLRREIKSLIEYQKGAILGLLEQVHPMDEATRKEIRRMLEA
jgi:hypothetical protein